MEVEVDSSPESFDLYEQKVAGQGDRFDSSNGILVGVLGAQIAVIVFYADVFAKSFATKADYWFIIVLLMLLVGAILVGSIIYGSDYRTAPEPNVFAVNVRIKGLEEARKLAIQDMDEAYAENDEALERRQSYLFWALLLTIPAIVIAIVIQSREERGTVPDSKPAAGQKNENQSWGKPNSIFTYRIGRTVHQVKLGADGNPVPGSMIARAPGVFGLRKRNRV